MTTAALVLAGGTGERARSGDVTPKQYRPLAGGRTAMAWAVDAFRLHPSLDLICEVHREVVTGNGVPGSIVAKGGATRQDSVRNGLEALAETNPSLVLIHDGVRPFVSAGLIDRVLAALDKADAVSPMLPVTDTLRKRTDAGFSQVARDGLLRAQTPQGFRFAAILDAHRRFAHESVTDDFALAERAGLSLATVPGEEINMKITTPEDFALAEKIAASSFGDIRTGTGFDAHRFALGDHVWLCGIKIPHDRGLDGHSDADVGLHALTDAILGALGAGDIGMHFPSSDPQWKNQPSHTFLARAVALVHDRRGVVANADVTLICESPKIGPYREAMRARIATLLEVDVARISVKATTTDGLGFTGRSEGIAAQAAATIRLPP